jgi:hypothetical protein
MHCSGSCCGRLDYAILMGMRFFFAGSTEVLENDVLKFARVEE